MKKAMMVWCVVLASMGMAVAQTKTNAPTAAATTSTNAVLGVEKFMKEVEGYKGRVQVEGVVQKVSAKGKSVALIDAAACGRCGEGCCTALALPVRWTGAMPSVGQVVRVTGAVQREKGKMVFVAGELKKVEPPAERK